MLGDIVKFIVDIVDWLGYIWIFIMMTLESSFFPFPSEVALIPAWFLIHEWKMAILPAFLAWIWGSLFGSYLNYVLWKYLWKPFLIKYWKYVFFKEEHYNKSEKYFKSHWTITTFLGRLIPVFRQYISFPAWVFSMNLPKFLFYTWLWAWIWSWILIAIWYIAGQNKELITEYSHLAIYSAIAFVILAWVIYYFYQKLKNKYPEKSASAIIIINRKWELLLQDRSNISKIWEKWWVFWWHLEKWEDKKTALIREIKEELNIDLLELKDDKNNFEFVLTQKVKIKSRKIITNRNYFLMLTDKQEKDFTVLEWAWCKYASIKKAEELLKQWRSADDEFWEWIEQVYNYYLKNYAKN